MEILAALGSLLKVMSSFAPAIAARIAALDDQARDYYKNSADAVQDADKLVGLGQQVKAENEAADAEYKKRGM